MVRKSHNVLLTNIKCRDAKLLLFLDGVFCGLITEQTTLPLWLFTMPVSIRAVVSHYHTRQASALKLDLTIEVLSEKECDLAEAQNVDCGTFLLQPMTQTWQGEQEVLSPTS
jgi:hypothetical protein